MGIGSWETLFFTLLGTSLTAAGSGALNHYLEREPDKLMARTKNRPLPAGLISPLHVIIFGVFMVISGSTLLVWKVNLLTGFLSIMTAFLYIIVYTPLKRITWLNTSVGSIPGALPIIGGWTAATGEIGTMAWILFAIMYLWQHPHFYAIAWMCKDDYAQADFKMLPVIEPDGSRTIRQIFWHLLLMIPVSLLPVVEGSLGTIYLIGVTIISCAFFLSAIPMARNKSRESALLLLKASVFYLPALLIIIIIDLGI
jgi:protoheme IX farnesyltransferase